MSSVVVSGYSSNGAASQATGGEGNPIELDDSSDNNTNSETENTPPPPVPVPSVFKEEGSSSNNNNNNNHSGEDGDEENSDDEDDIKMDVARLMDESTQGDKTEDDEQKSVGIGNGNGNGSVGENNNNDHSNDHNNNNDDDNDGGNHAVENVGIEQRTSTSPPSNPGEETAGTATPGTLPGKAVRSRTQKKENLWGNIESMSEITKSPYEGNECAEVGEDSFEEFRSKMDRSETTPGRVNPAMEALVGDKLARDLCNAHHEIGKSGMLYSANWKEGKIRDSDFGWIPKRQLLLCLHEQRFARGTEIVLQAVTKNLDCSRLVLEAMALWDLMDDYPHLASNKDEDAPLAFETRKIACYKCQIFVARAFATLQILNKTEGIQPSLTKKIRACLRLMNDRVRVNHVELARMNKKASRKRKAPNEQPAAAAGEASDDTTFDNDDIDSVEASADRKRRAPTDRPGGEGRKSAPGGAGVDATGGGRSSSLVLSGPSGHKPRAASGPVKGGPSANTAKPRARADAKRRRRRKVQKREEREESILMLFNTMHSQVHRLNQMMSFFQSQLQDHRGILREELRENLERDREEKNGAGKK